MIFLIVFIRICFLDHNAYQLELLHLSLVSKEVIQLFFLLNLVHIRKDQITIILDI